MAALLSQIRGVLRRLGRLRGDLAMRQSAFLLGVVVFLAGTAGAQTRLDNPAAPNPSASDGAAISQGISQEQSSPQLFALAGDPSSNGASGAADASSASSPAAVSSPAPASPF